ncbi:MAG: DUF1499 domain-containing protein [Pseudomonadota bacterium]
MIRIVILLVAIVTVLLGVAVMAAGPGYRFGLWGLGDAFTILRTVGPWLAYGGIASAVALVIGLVSRQRSVLMVCLLAIGMSGGLTYMLTEQRARGPANPIHDLTTDFTDPPAIIAAASAERSNPPNYAGDAPYGDTGKSVIRWQQELYPDLQAQIFKSPADTVFDAAADTLLAMKMDVLTTDKNAGRLEAAYTSPWFGFVDDFIVRIQTIPNGDVRVDLRSKSRIGRSDLGANVARIKAFQKRLDDRLNPAG